MIFLWQYESDVLKTIKIMAGHNLNNFITQASYNNIIVDHEKKKI
jgi:hypothetical protein